MNSKMGIWTFPVTCDCGHCKGGTNKHAWSFYYYCKRQGDKVTMAIFGDILQMSIYSP